MELEFQNQIANVLATNPTLLKALTEKLGLTEGLNKADTVSQATGLLWYDLSPLVRQLYAFKELTPLISKLPRVPANGGTAHHWKRVTQIDPNRTSGGVSEGNRAARIALTVQDQVTSYKTMGFESSTTFEARLAAKNLNPEPLGLATQSTLRRTLIFEEQALMNGNASTALGTTPTPTLSAGGTTGAWGGTVTVYVICVALSGFGFQDYTPYNSATGLGGVRAQVTKINADGSSDTFGGGSAKPSNEAALAGVTTGQVVTASVTSVAGAIGYAWFVGTSSAGETLAGITAANRATFTQPGAATSQPITALQVTGVYADNSLNTLVPDGILSQIFGNVSGAQYVPNFVTNPNLPANVTFSSGGSLVYTAAAGNSGLTINGANITEFDAILQAAYEQYKLGFDRILMSSADIASNLGAFLNSSSTQLFRIMFDASASDGSLIAGRRITGYKNKFMNNTLDIDLHPWVPPGTIIFWSDRVPYEMSGVGNILEAMVRQDYYQIEWPLRTRRYEFGVYVDELFKCEFTPGFAVITNLNPASGVPGF